MFQARSASRDAIHRVRVTVIATAPPTLETKPKFIVWFIALKRMCAFCKKVVAGFRFGR